MTAISEESGGLPVWADTHPLTIAPLSHPISLELLQYSNTYRCHKFIFLQNENVLPAYDCTPSCFCRRLVRGPSDQYSYLYYLGAFRPSLLKPSSYCWMGYQCSNHCILSWYVFLLADRVYNIPTILTLPYLDGRYISLCHLYPSYRLWVRQCQAIVRQ